MPGRLCDTGVSVESQLGQALAHTHTTPVETIALADEDAVSLGPALVSPLKYVPVAHQFLTLDRAGHTNANGQCRLPCIPAALLGYYWQLLIPRFLDQAAGMAPTSECESDELGALA